MLETTTVIGTRLQLTTSFLRPLLFFEYPNDKNKKPLLIPTI
jgi:hypothetical protein